MSENISHHKMPFMYFPFSMILYVHSALFPYSSFFWRVRFGLCILRTRICTFRMLKTLIWNYVTMARGITSFVKYNVYLWIAVRTCIWDHKFIALSRLWVYCKWAIRNFGTYPKWSSSHLRLLHDIWNSLTTCRFKVFNPFLLLWY